MHFWNLGIDSALMYELISLRFDLDFIAEVIAAVDCLVGVDFLYYMEAVDLA